MGFDQHQRVPVQSLIFLPNRALHASAKLRIQESIFIGFVLPGDAFLCHVNMDGIVIGIGAIGLPSTAETAFGHAYGGGLWDQF